jgi:RNA polymerase subunit RPABC4/transcription elongation factor Spt4
MLAASLKKRRSYVFSKQSNDDDDDESSAEGRPSETIRPSMVFDESAEGRPSETMQSMSNLDSAMHSLSRASFCETSVQSAPHNPHPQRRRSSTCPTYEAFGRASFCETQGQRAPKTSVDVPPLEAETMCKNCRRHFVVGGVSHGIDETFEDGGTYFCSGDCRWTWRLSQNDEISRSRRAGLLHGDKKVVVCSNQRSAAISTSWRGPVISTRTRSSAIAPKCDEEELPVPQKKNPRHTSASRTASLAKQGRHQVSAAFRLVREGKAKDTSTSAARRRLSCDAKVLLHTINAQQS